MLLTQKLCHTISLLSLLSFSSAARADSFLEFCTMRDPSLETAFTVDALLYYANVVGRASTETCNEANHRLAKLETINFWRQGIPIVDPRPITTFTNVKSVMFYNSPDLHLPLLAEAEHITLLAFDQTNFRSDFARLAANHNLRKLVLRNSSLADWDQLAAFLSVEELVIYRPTGELGDLGFMSKMSKLRKADFTELAAQAFASLEGERLPSLEAIRIADVPILDLLGFSAFEGLREIYFENVPRVKSIDQLGTLRNLKSLSMVADTLEFARDLSQLESLRLQKGSTVTDVTPLRKSQEIRQLELEYSQVSDISPLSGLKHLDTLRLPRTVRNLEPLKGLSKLVSLCIDADEPIDVAPLANLADLQWLTIGKAQPKSLEALKPLREPHLNSEGREISLYVDAKNEYACSW